MFAYYAEGNVQARRDRRAKSKEPGQAGLQRDLESEWREREGGDKVKEQKGKQELSGEMRPLQGAEAFAVCDAIWELLNKTWTSWTADQQSFQIFTNSSPVILFCTYSINHCV